MAGRKTSKIKTQNFFLEQSLTQSVSLPSFSPRGHTPVPAIYLFALKSLLCTPCPFCKACKERTCPKHPCQLVSPQVGLWEAAAEAGRAGTQEARGSHPPSTCPGCSSFQETPLPFLIMSLTPISSAALGWEYLPLATNLWVTTYPWHLTSSMTYIAGF